MFAPAHRPPSVPETLSLRRYGASLGSHSHDHFQMLVGLSGTLELEVAGRGLRVEPGLSCAIAPGEAHDFVSPQGSVCLVLDSPHTQWEVLAMARAPAPSGKAPLLPASAWPLVHYLAGALQHDRPLAHAHGAALLREAWLGATCDAPRPHRTPPRQRPIPWAALAQWAAQHWHEALSVADLAAQVHLSPSQFAARCRDEQGVAAMAWLRGQRLEHARLLRTQGHPVAAIAQRTGYRSPSALTAALRRTAGQPAVPTYTGAPLAAWPQTQPVPPTHALPSPR